MSEERYTKKEIQNMYRMFVKVKAFTETRSFVDVMIATEGEPWTRDPFGVFAELSEFFTGNKPPKGGYVNDKD